ncbi:hypothetical protein [Methanobacterium sp. SMA-27]|uniref:hypothetical protein n=1 Tax=Methanobacterium sp. SMA-27 TaxID=1495336 RepID=UPI00064FF0CA|nr:hypothetical protein [Methanobacterium sp. SMA-27]
MYNKLTDIGDKLIGEKIFTQFRNFEPKKEPKEYKDGIRKSYTLSTMVVCVIEKPVRKKQS